MRVTLATVLLALALSAPASAATISSTSDRSSGVTRIEYLAGPGEVNDVVAQSVDGGVRVTDTGAPIAATGECTADGDGAFCPTPVGTGSGTSGSWARIELADGDDRVDWRTGSSDANGGPGADRIVATGTVDGGPGADVIAAQFVSYRTRTAGVEVTLDDAANDGEPGEGDNVRLGPFILGGSGPDLLSAEGAAGRVSLQGGGGDDRLIGGAADDNMYGEDGADFVDGRGGADYLRGDDGPDEIVGGGAADGDEVIPGSGSDSVTVGSQAQLELRDTESDSVACGYPGALRIDADPIDRLTGCTFAYLRFSPVARVYTSRERRVRVRVQCDSSIKRPCHGAVRLLRRGTRTVLASGTFHLEHRETGVIELNLRAAGRKLRGERSSVAARLIAVHAVPSDPPSGRNLDGRDVRWVTGR